MIKMLFPLPQHIDLAFSGGIDSLTVAHFLSQSKKNLRLWHFNHGCEYSNEIEKQCREKAEELKLDIVVGYLNGTQGDRQSKEDFWRQQRYRFLRSSERYMMTAHHLDDAVETWLWSSLHGEGKIIPVQNRSIIRPFLLTSKTDFQKYANHHDLKEVADAYNEDLNLMRNYMRANMMEHAYKINPGLDKVVRKKYLSLGKIELLPLPEPVVEKSFKPFK